MHEIFKGLSISLKNILQRRDPPQSLLASQHKPYLVLLSFYFPYCRGTRKEVKMEHSCKGIQQLQSRCALGAKTLRLGIWLTFVQRKKDVHNGTIVSGYDQ